MRREVKYKIKGMNKDSSFSAFSPEFSFENRNIRITTLEGNTTLSIVNEKGTKQLNYTCYNKDGDIIGLDTIIGYCVINNILVLFTTGNDDGIYKAVFKNEDSLEIKQLFHGNLELDFEHQIETLGIYENENNIKVYWVDGKNQPRVINIMDDPSKFNVNYFDFVPSIKIKDFYNSNNVPIIDITHSDNGVFPAGVIQYCFTYYNLNKAETNIFYTSPLYYITHADRGGSPEDTINKSFTITIRDWDASFERIRVYSILRTSENITPICKVVGDLNIKDLNTSSKSGTSLALTLVDTGNIGYIIDPADLLYVGGENISAGTIEQKDNTLFLGDLKVDKLIIPEEVVKAINNTNGTTDRLSFRIPLEVNRKSDSYNAGYKYYNTHVKSFNLTGDYLYDNQSKGNNSHDIKIFKYLEWYRCGIQFQHKSGKWSEPVWIRDVQNKMAPRINGDIDHKNDTSYEMLFAKPHFDISKVTIGEGKSSLSEYMHNKGYVAVRPVIIYPTDIERNCICQGVLNPTVFNVGDRHSKTAYSQASWFFRPIAHYTYPDNNNYYSETNWKNGELNSLSNNFSEYRHLYCLPDNRANNAEIQCIEQSPNLIYTGYIQLGNADTPINHLTCNNITDTQLPSSSDFNPEEWEELFVVDHSTVTLNSPEIEFENILSNTSFNGLHITYSGVIPITGIMVDCDIQVEGGLTSPNARGFIKWENLNIKNTSGEGQRYFNRTYSFEDKTIPENFYRFATYPWHGRGNISDNWGGHTAAKLKSNKRSALLSSSISCYLSNTTDLPGSLKIQEGSICNNSFMQFSDGRIYKKDIDSLINISRSGAATEVPQEREKINNKGSGYYTSRVRAGGDTYNNSLISKEEDKIDSSQVCRYELRLSPKSDETTKNRMYSTDPVSIKYKSTPHLVISSTDTMEDYVPDFFYENLETNKEISLTWYKRKSLKYFWDTQNKDYYRRIITVSRTPNDTLRWVTDRAPRSYTESSNLPGCAFLWLVDITRDDGNTPVSDETSYTYSRFLPVDSEQLQWLVAGDSYPLSKDSDLTLVWKEGDHYFQRYDCLKTYPYTLEDKNSVVEILSFLCETRVNLDGRYDRNRGKESNLVMTPTNFNLINPVYSQQNNFFNYRIAEKQYQEIDDYMNSITWSKTKIFGEKIDTWTNITLASILDLDGNKGRVESIKRLNNDLIAFQERGISQILYNDNVQISTQSGVPVEIANSGKVQGKRYLSSYIGCNNKWSICESPAGLYFIDDNTKGIYLFNGNLTNLSDKLGFSSWAKDNLKENNFISYYDPIESEVLFLNDTECLTYSERLGAFTSFYNYTNATIPINMGNRTLLVGDPTGDSRLKFYEYHAGYYNDFYGKFIEKDGEIVYEPNFKNFSVELIVNPEPTKDKIFNTVEFRADAFNTEGRYLESTKPFSNIQVKNEYQDTGDISLNNINLRKKFRIWRHAIQRDKDYKRDRIRNPWATIILKNENPADNKVVLHDVVVSYFD